MSVVPRIIHQTWKTKTIPERVQILQKSWFDYHPDWKYILWTDEDIDEFIKNEYEWFYPYWSSYPHHIQRVDAFRYFVMHKYGGVYADLDMQCLTPFDPLFQKASGVILGQEGMMHADNMMRVGNAIIISPPNHPFWNHVFDALAKNHNLSTDKITSVFVTTGPSFLHEVYRAHPQGVSVLPSNAFYPIPWSMPKETLTPVSRKQYPQSWAAHHWEGMWRSAPRVLQVPFNDAVLKFMTPRKRADGYGIIEQKLENGEFWRPVMMGKLSEWIQPGDACVVIPGYIGQVVVPVAHLAGENGMVYTFEPDARPRDLLTSTLEANGLKNVQIDERYPSSSATRMFNVSRFDVKKPHRTIWRGGKSVTTGNTSTVGVPLDSIGLTSVAFVHIEASGEEAVVLQGAKNVIATNKPMMTIEIWQDDRRQFYGSPLKMAQTLAILRQFNYEAHQLEGDLYLCIPTRA